MEASALPVTPGIAPPPLRVPAPLLRFRSDEQLLGLFRCGHEEAFRAIHERYHDRLLAYTRQMLPSLRHDAEDAVQEVFVRAYRGLRADERALTLRPWLYRVAHNRCIDLLRCQIPTAVDSSQEQAARALGPGLPHADPSLQAERREELARLVSDIRRLPDQQRSALLMRELGGMGHVEIGAALGATVPAVKSLLVRARIGLVEAAEARDASCAFVQRELALAHERRTRPSPLARRHLRDCAACSEFRAAVRGTSRDAAALLPGIGGAGLLARLLGVGGSGGAAAAGGASAGGGGAAVAGATSAGALGAGATHVASLVAAAMITAGGAVAIQPSIPPAAHPHHHRTLHQPLVRAAASAAGTALATALHARAAEPAAGLSGSAASLLALAQPPAQTASGPARRPSAGSLTPSLSAPGRPVVSPASRASSSTARFRLSDVTPPSGSQTPSGAQSPAGAQPPSGATTILSPSDSGTAAGRSSTIASGTSGSDTSPRGPASSSSTDGSTSSPTTSTTASSSEGSSGASSDSGSGTTSGTSSTSGPTTSSGPGAIATSGTSSSTSGSTSSGA